MEPLRLNILYLKSHTKNKAPGKQTPDFST